MIGARVWWLTVAALALEVLPCRAQVLLTRSTFNSGTGISENAQVRLGSVLGECAVGMTANASLRSTFGFWVLAGEMGAGPGGSALDTQFALAPAAPNPFRGMTTLQFELPRSGPTRLAIYDLGGRLIRTLLDEEMPAGRFDASWDGSDESGRKVSSGVYLYRLETRGLRDARKVIRLD